MDTNNDGKITREEAQAYFTSNFANKTPDQIAAELKHRGFAVDIDELKDEATQNITADSFAEYLFDEVDQNSEFKANKATGSITASSDGGISREELAEVFIQPKQSDWNNSDGMEELQEFMDDLKRSDEPTWQRLMGQIPSSAGGTAQPNP
jgi:hypothetical protein